MADKRNKIQNNPRNAQSELFKRLTRLLSGPIVNYRRQQVRTNKRQGVDKYAKTFKSASGQQFKKKAYNPFDNIMAKIMFNQSRLERYNDFDQMEFTPELASAMDIYADEITAHSEQETMLEIDCKNEEIKEILNILFYQVLNIEYNLYSWARATIKYGDFFLYLDIDEELGIKNVIGLPSGELERLEGEDKKNPNYIQYQWNSAGMTLENWQVAHFRVLGNNKYSPYGTSVLDPARRIWRQLVLLEDAMMAYRVVRAPDRRVFYIDVGGINPEDVEQFMQKAMTQMKRHSVVDSKTGQVDLRYNPASIEEDFYIPVRGGTSGTKIETLAGTSWANDIDDVKYLRDKLFAAIKIPMSYLIRGEGGEEDKTTLAQKDIRFARTIQRLQRSIVSELEKLAIVHLYTLGYRGEDLVNFKFSLHNPSKIAQLQELEHWRTKLELSESAVARFFSNRWVAKNMLNISEEEFVRNQRERFYDKKIEAATAASAEAATSEAAGAEAGAATGAGDMGDMAADMGDMGDMGAEPGAEMPGAPAEAPAAEPAADEGGGFEGLLAAPAEAGPPAKRDDDAANQYDWIKVKRKSYSGKVETTTDKSKGKWYTPVTTDKRDMGARKKNMMAQGGHRQGGRRGMGLKYDFDSLSKGIVSEHKSNYHRDMENDLFKTNNEIRVLLESLETKNDKIETQ